MKKRKGLIAIIVICVVSFVATVALGIACLSTMLSEAGLGRIERAWYEFAERYNLNNAFDIVDDFDHNYDYDYHYGYEESNYYDRLTSVQQADAENRIDLSAVPQGCDLEISCDNVPVTVQSGDAAAAQLSFSDASEAPAAGAFLFELFRAPDDLNRYLLVLDFSMPITGARLDVTLPASYISRLEIDCDNASMAINGISCDTLAAEADNGCITAENLTVGQSMELTADNGRIALTNPSCEGSVNCDADNGSILFSAGNLTYYTIDASAKNGRIVNNLASPAQSLTDDSLHYEHHREDGSTGARLYFQTDNGSIELNP